MSSRESDLIVPGQGKERLGRRQQEAAEGNYAFGNIKAFGV